MLNGGWGLQGGGAFMHHNCKLIIKDNIHLTVNTCLAPQSPRNVTHRYINGSWDSVAVIDLVLLGEDIKIYILYSCVRSQSFLIIFRSQNAVYQNKPDSLSMCLFLTCIIVSNHEGRSNQGTLLQTRWILHLLCTLSTDSTMRDKS